jgi:endonuclease/exonuclease/phosphatase (EEP) superfamily protein YafD
VLRFALAVVFTLVVAVFALPDLLGLDQRSPFAQIVSFRPWALVAVLGLLVVLLIVLWFERRVWPFVAGTLAVLLVGAGMVAPRLIADPVPTDGTPFTVLAFNAYVGGADVDALAALIRTTHPDVVSVEEAGERFRSRLAPLVEPLGYHLHTSVPAGKSDVGGVTAAVADELGDVSVRIGHETSAFPYVEVTGGGLGTLRFVAFHSVAPVPGSVPRWSADLALLQQWCAGSTPAVVAGDFNATLDHSALRSGTAGCGDAASQRGAGLIPTWGPSPGTRAIGPQIDHVFATRGITAETFDVHDVPGSDHRAVVTTLRLP